MHYNVNGVPVFDRKDQIPPKICIYCSDGMSADGRLVFDKLVNVEDESYHCPNCGLVYVYKGKILEKNNKEIRDEESRLITKH